MSSTFPDHLSTCIAAGLERIPETVRSDVYVVNLWVAPVTEDPRHIAMSVSANTRAEAARTGVFEAWTPGVYAFADLASCGDPADDPAGAAAWRAYAEHNGVSWEDVPPEDEDEDVVADLLDLFAGALTEAAVLVHRDVLPARVGDTCVLTVDSEDPRVRVHSLLLALNPRGVPEQAEAWYSDIDGGRP